MEFKHVFILWISLVVSLSSWSQIINFTDLELKSYLINEPCVDTTTVPNNNGIGHMDVDINNDNEIQVSEALLVKKMLIRDFDDNYSIQSIQDFSQFKNLTLLSVREIDDIVDISNLNLDSLKSLFISQCSGLKRIDISDLVGLTESLRLENLGDLDYLNIKNGSVAKAFSLFYTENTKYACVDSIAKEYDMFYNHGGMLPGVSPSINCVTSIDDEVSMSQEIQIYPNLVEDYFSINSNNEEVREVLVFDISGRLVKSVVSGFEYIDISNLKKGIYHAMIYTDTQKEVHPLVVQ
jgi:hypothetical protein